MQLRFTDSLQNFIPLGCNAYCYLLRWLYCVIFTPSKFSLLYFLDCLNIISCNWQMMWITLTLLIKIIYFSRIIYIWHYIEWKILFSLKWRHIFCTKNPSRSYFQEISFFMRSKMYNNLLSQADCIWYHSACHRRYRESIASIRIL